MTEGFVEVGGGRLFYEDTGAGKPVVLIHGGLWDRRIWDPQLPELSHPHRVIRYDVRGYGRSSRIEVPYADHEDLAALLDVLGIDQAAIVGLSMGARIAVEAAITFPNRVGALVLTPWALSGFDGWSEETVRRDGEVDAAVDDGDLVRAVGLELGIWTPLRIGDDAAQRRIAHENAQQLTADDELRRRLEPPAHQRLAEVVTPALVITGEQDLPEMLVIAEILSTGIPWARRVVLSDADHLPNVRRPEEFNRLVLEFLEGAPA